MKVFLLYENDRPYSGYVRAVFTTNDDVEITEDMRVRLSDLDCDIREWTPQHVRTSEELTHSIIQEVRDVFNQGPGDEWPDTGYDVEETPPLDDKAHDHEHDADFCDKCMQCCTCDACECSPGQNDIDTRNTHANKDHPDCPACRIERAEQDDIECSLPHPHIAMVGCNGVCKHTHTYCNDRSQEVCKSCGEELGR